MRRAEFAVIGAGILGLATARELLRRHPRERVIVVEQADAIAAHQSGHNSGVIHAGVYYAPGSLKAKLCVAGARRMYEYCEQHGIEARKVGKLIIARNRSELSGLDQLERRARANGVPGLERIEASRIAELEPHARGVAGLYSPSTGIADFAAVCRRLAEDVGQAGGEIRLSWTVADAQEAGGLVRLLGPGDEAIDASCAVFCAGLWADRLAVRAGAPADPRIVPFRGSYLRLRENRRHLVRGLIYPVPDPSLPFLGVHLTPRLDGEVLLGPSALPVGARDAYRATRVRPRDAWDSLAWPGTWRMGARWWRTGLRELRMAASHRAFAAEAAGYVPALRASDLVPGPAGVRAQAVGRDGRLIDDFVLSSTERTIHVRNAPSPAATSALALAETIADAVESLRL